MDIVMFLVFGVAFAIMLGLILMAFLEKPQIVGRNEAVKRMLKSSVYQHRAARKESLLRGVIGKRRGDGDIAG